MGSVTKKVTWILKEVTEEKLKIHDDKNSIISEAFTINFGDHIYDKWYFVAKSKEELLNFFVHCANKNLDPDLYVSMKFFCGQKLINSLQKKGENFKSLGHGTYIIATNQLKTYMDQNNNLTLSVEITLTKTNANPKVNTSIQQNTARESYAEFLDDETISDASFMCCDGVKVPVHRLVLIKKSAAFKTIFDTMKAQHKSVHSFVEIDSITFKEVLKYIYTGNADLKEIDLVTKVYRAAVKFVLPELKMQCLDSLDNQIDSKNVLKIFKIAKELKVKELRDKTLHFILKYFHAIKFSTEWEEFDANLKEVVFDASCGNTPNIVLETTL